jgi:hypothetical protein
MRSGQGIQVSGNEAALTLPDNAPVRTIKLMRETYWMAAISIVDLILTLWLINRGLATEANPLMQNLLNMGVGWFIGFKCLCTFGPLAALELIQRKHGDMVRRYLRLGILAYMSSHIGNIICAMAAAHLFG